MIARLLLLGLLLVAGALPAAAQMFPQPGPGRSPTGPGDFFIVQLFVATMSEPNGAIGFNVASCIAADNPAPCCTGSGTGDCRLRYNNCFYDNASWTAGVDGGEDEAFDIVPTEMRICRARVSQQDGNLDANDDGLMTFRICPGGDVSSCTWEDLETQAGGAPYRVDIDPTDLTTDLFWDNTGCSEVINPGDAISCQWETDVGSTWAGGADESPELSFEGHNLDANEFAVMSSAEGFGAFSSLYAQAIMGGHNQGFDTSDADNLSIPVPGAYTVLRGYGALQSDPGSQRNVNLCLGGSGNDCGTGGGTALLTVPINTGGTSLGSDSTCTGTCTLAAGDRLVWSTGSNANDSNVKRAMSIAFGSTGGRWFNGGNRPPGQDSWGFSAGNSSVMCNTGSGGVTPNCRVNVQRSWTATALQCFMNAALSSGSLDLVLQENASDSALNCAMSSGVATQSDSGTITIDADNDLDIEMDSTSPSGGSQVGWGLQWNSQ